MALADVLSAMRELILDAPVLPAEPSERERLFSTRFPRLTDIEREDLARIDPKKFSIYTTSIFQSEKGILENHLPITFALVKDTWAEAYKEKFIGRQLTWKLHLSRPWESASPQEFAANFVDFINHDCPELLALRSDLGSIALLECANYRLKRAPDVKPPKGIAIDALAALTVADLLEASVAPTSPLECLQLTHDARAVRESYYANGKQYPAQPGEKGHFLVAGGRLPDNSTTWTAVRPGIFEFLNASPRSETTVESFADLVLQDVPQELSPEKALECVTAELTRLMANGLVTLVPRASGNS